MADLGHTGKRPTANPSQVGVIQEIGNKGSTEDRQAPLKEGRWQSSREGSQHSSAREGSQHGSGAGARVAGAPSGGDAVKTACVSLRAQEATQGCK